MMPVALALICWLFAQGAPVSTLRGSVLDASGAPISGAIVEASAQRVATDARGTFALPVVAWPVELRVRAEGFADYVARVTADRAVRITLHPAGIAESVTVTAGRSLDRIADTSTATSVIAAPVLLTAASLMVDDALRTVPGFSLFRRSSSRVANPTVQGGTLRGLSASGASRALVLADGVPLNDPYGGWVYWDRIPIAAIERLEVIRGGAAEALYGNQSIGGTVQVVTFAPSAASLRLSLEGGQHVERRVSVYAGARERVWNAFASGERFVLGGFPIVAADERGTVDVNAGVKYWSGLADAGVSAARWALGLRANWLEEGRANGTPLQRNDTSLWSIGVHGRSATRFGAFAYTASGGSSRYNQSFSSVNATRSAEILTRTQHVTSDHAGGSAQWFGTWGRQTAMVGADAQRISGGGAPADSGVQQDYATYAQLQFRAWPAATITAGVRAGRWSTTLKEATGFDRTVIYVLPRLSIAWAAGPALSLTASWSNPSRTPTLNELYREFQVGNTFTLANARLEPEEAQSVEVGALVRRGRGSARMVAYWTSLDSAIANVTIAATGGFITRQRRNAGEIRARGVEAEGEWRIKPWSAISGSVALVDSRFTASIEPGLAGRRVPQVPRAQGTLSLRLTPGRAVLTMDWRGVGPQFDDDRNLFELGSAQVLDLYAGANLAHGIQPFVAIENLFDEVVDVGRTPVRTTGTPRSARAGLRLFFR